VIRLPASFTPTHQTAGLPGYPAIDVFGLPRELVRVEFYGRVIRVAGRAPTDGGRPGGPYGRSLYILNLVNGQERYLTHLDELAVEVGDFVGPGSIVATVCDSLVSGKPGTTHVHLGHKRP
jgi:hypothetical protein